MQQLQASARFFAVSFTIAALLLVSCTQKMVGWSEVRSSKDGSDHSIGTLGLGLSKGASGKIKFSFGPSGSAMGPTSPEVEKDMGLLGETVPVGSWTIEKGNDKIVLPHGSDGYVKTFDYYENIDKQLWSVISSPGCSTLTTSLSTGTGSSGTIIQRKYSLCEVDGAVDLLNRK